MITAMHQARDHVDQHMALLKPGVAIRDLIHGHQLASEYWAQKWS